MRDRLVACHLGERAHQPSARFDRERFPSGQHEAAQLAAYLRCAPLGEQRLSQQGALRQGRQRVAQAGNRGLNSHGTAQSELRRRVHDTGLVGKEGPCDDADVAALPLHGLSRNLAILEGDNGRIEEDVSARCIGAALDRGVQLTVNESDGIGGLHGDITAAGLGCCCRHGGILAEELRAGIDGNVTGIRRAGAAG